MPNNDKNGKRVRRPGDLILDRYMPNATEEEREAARQHLRDFAAALLRIFERLAREEESSSCYNSAMSDEAFMRLALEQAKLTLAENEFPVGAVVVAEGKVIGRGRKSSSDFHLGHAETAAIQQALQGKRYTRKDDLVLYTTLEPCTMCYGTMLHCPIRKVVFGLDDPWGGATQHDALALPARHREKVLEVVGGVLKEESRRLLREFLSITNDPYWKNWNNPLIKRIME